MKLLLTALFACLFAITAIAQDIKPLKTERWHGFEKVSFLFDGLPAYYVRPPKPLAGHPWVWRAHFPDWHVTMDSLLLERGFHIAYVNTNDRYGAPSAMMVWDHFYDYLTEKLAFAPKVALEGVSRGGLYVYGWAKRNPEKVSCIYAEAPVCDFKSWPGGKGKSKGDEKAWKQLMEVYGFTEEQALAYTDNPIDHLEGLAAYKVPILHVIGPKDALVPNAENTYVLVDRYQKLGGPAMVYSMTRGAQALEGHHFPIEHPDWWANFIEQASVPVVKPLAKAPYMELRAGLPNSFKTITHAKQATVAFLGGSITHNPGWRDKVSQFLQERFPDTKFTFIKAGIPSLGSLPHAFRFQQDVLDKGKPDLLFIEAAVNDRGNGTDSLTQIRALEGIIRHARKTNPAMDIVLMSFAEPHKSRDYQAGKTPLEVANHERVAAYYKLPSINLAREVYDRIQAGEFTWEYDFKDLHPSPFGQEIYYQTIKALLNRCLASTADAPVPVTGAALPKPMNAHNFERGHYKPIHDAQLGGGWELVENWQPTDKTPTREGFVKRPMLVATQPGSTLTLSFTGTAVGMGLISGPDAGVVEYRIDNGPYQKMDLYTPWSNQLHLPWYKLFGAGLPDKKHTLQVRISSDKHEKSTGNACRIVYFLEN